MCVLCQPILTRHDSKIIIKKKTIFSLPLSSSHLPQFSKNIEGLKQCWRSHNLFFFFFFFFFHIFLSSAKSSERIANFTKKSSKGDVHTPKPTINGTHNKIQWETHATNSDPPKKERKRINPAVSTSNFTSILQYPSHKEQHRQQYY